MSFIAATTSLSVEYIALSFAFKVVNIAYAVPIILVHYRELLVNPILFISLIIIALILYFAVSDASIQIKRQKKANNSI